MDIFKSPQGNNFNHQSILPLFQSDQLINLREDYRIKIHSPSVILNWLCDLYYSKFILISQDYKVKLTSHRKPSLGHTSMDPQMFELLQYGQHVHRREWSTWTELQCLLTCRRRLRSTPVIAIRQAEIQEISRSWLSQSAHWSFIDI